MIAPGDLSAAPFWSKAGSETAIIELAEDGVERAITFGELKASVSVFADALGHRGVQRGERIAVAGENALEHLIAQLGVLRAGGVATLLNVRLPESVNQDLLDSLQVDLVIADAANSSLSQGRSLIAFEDIPTDARLVGSASDHQSGEALIMFTSGSTGAPKAVPITHEGYVWALDAFKGLGDTLGDGPGLVAAPLFHMNGQFHLFNMLSVGATVVLMKRFNAEQALNAIERRNVVRMTGVPTMAALMAQAQETGNGWNTNSVLQLAMGSAPLSKAMFARFKAAFPEAAITNGYGTTETGPGSFGPHPKGLATPPTALGYPLDGVETQLDNGPSPDEGVLKLRNPMTFRGYIGRDDATAEKLDTDGWYDSGDRMRRDANGFFYFLGRSDDMLQVGAENVYPAQVERVLEQHPEVREAVVVGVPHAIKGAAPVAFVRAKDTLTEETLKAFALANGPAYAHPRRIWFVDEIPLATTNKIDRNALTKIAEARAADLSRP